MVFVLGLVCVCELDHNLASEPRITAEIDGPHASAPYLTHHLVATNACSGQVVGKNLACHGFAPKAKFALFDQRVSRSSTNDLVGSGSGCPTAGAGGPLGPVKPERTNRGSPEESGGGLRLAR